MFKIDNKEKAVKFLQYAKNYFQNVAVDSNEDPTVISNHLQMIDEVQLFLQPDLDFEELQNMINSEK